MFHVPCYSSALPLFLIGLSFPIFLYASHNSKIKDKTNDHPIAVWILIVLIVIFFNFVSWMTREEKNSKNRYEKNRVCMISCYKYMLMFLVLYFIGGCFLIASMTHTFEFLSCTNFAILICLLSFVNQTNVIKIFYLKNLKEVFACIFIHIVSFIAGAYLFDDTSPEVYSAKITFFRVNIFYLFLINLDLYLFYKYQFMIGDRQTSMDPGSSVYYLNTEGGSNPAANLSNGVDMTGGPMNEQMDIYY